MPNAFVCWTPAASASTTTTTALMVPALASRLRTFALILTLMVKVPPVLLAPLPMPSSVFLPSPSFLASF